ncbi:YhdH/YhfP family quinone oxidoreductase [Gammaproteobacteria bacterium]|nr:YhdH/YhfP family quinone oxidoreductase [Gammaproteobacteria bacterium]MDC0443158.1 YhdH/YhfP family quinone oxidoreductase [Gammaproteobacteria bacterium]
MQYSAYYVEEKDGVFSASISKLELEKPADGFVQINVSHSSLNYKDALSASGNKGVTRNYPFVPGIDAAGIITDANSSSFNEGDEVIVTGYDLGMNTPGGFGEYINVPAGWVVKKPSALTSLEAMSIGTAGLTAAASALKIYESSQESDLPVLVSGATGGVGSIGVMLMSKLGKEVSALTGKSTSTDFLKSIGASNIIMRDEYLETPAKAMERPMFSSAIDTVGGNVLSKMLPQISPHGVVACCGNVAGIEVNTTVFPFILRGITLSGIDSAESSLAFKTSIWNKFADEWNLDLSSMIKTVTKENLQQEIDLILQGGQQGRVVLKHGE